MIQQHGCVEQRVGIILPCIIAVVMLRVTMVWAEQLDQTNYQLLNKNEYRVPIEEVVVVGKQPQWRTDKPEPWRSERFVLSSEFVKPSRIQWLPEYTKDEYDLYQGVRDRTGEKAEIKLFEWKF